MGEIADQMINGSACELCLMPFADPKNHKRSYEHGYPVVCDDCWKGLRPDEKKHHQKATAKTIGE